MTPAIPDLFESLRAEQEAEWLLDLFVPPRNLPLLTGGRSYVMYGARGSGKSTISSYLNQMADERHALVVRWYPPRPLAAHSPSESTSHSLTHLLGTFAERVLRFIALHPALFTQAPSWAQKLLLWFLKGHIAEWDYLVSRISDDEPTVDRELLESLQGQGRPALFYGEVAPEQLLREVARALRTLEVAEVWFIIDGMESWLATDPETLATSLRALFSSLVYFEDPRYLWRFMLPLELEQPLRTSGALARRRLDVHHLTWDNERLRRIVEQRLAAQLAVPSLQLSELVAADELAGWLEHYGGQTPHGWLSLVAPIVSYLMHRPSAHPISNAEWGKLRQRFAPRLHIELATGRVTIGQGEIRSLQASETRILRHLYEQPTRTATRRDLYFLAYRNLPSTPRSTHDAHWEGEAQWGPMMDTIIWRIRKTLEPARGKRAPLYLISHRGKGTIELDRVG